MDKNWIIILLLLIIIFSLLNEHNKESFKENLLDKRTNNILPWINSENSNTNFVKPVNSKPYIVSVNSPAGRNKLSISSINGFKIGDIISINPNNSNSESKTVVGIGNGLLLLDSILNYTHKPNEPIYNMSNESIHYDSEGKYEEAKYYAEINDDKLEYSNPDKPWGTKIKKIKHDYLYSNQPYYLKNLYGIQTYFASCGRTYCGKSNLAVATYKNTDNSYLHNSPEWSKWVFVKKDGSNGPINFDDIITIRLKANNWYLVTCNRNYCNSSAYLSVSAAEYNGPSNIFAGNAQYWKITSPEGKTGPVSMTDKFKILNLWGDGSYLNSCGWFSGCGEGKYYAMNTAKQNSGDSQIDTTNWMAEKKI